MFFHLVLFLNVDVSQAEPLKLEEVSILLKMKGVMTFANAIQTKQFPPISIPSQRFCNAITNKIEQKLVQQRRDFGLVLLKKINAISTVSKKKEFGTIDDLFVIRKWCFENPSYGNLMLGWAAENKAITLLFQEMVDSENSFRKLKSRVNACFKNNPTSDFWLKMLDEEGEVLFFKKEDFNKKTDELKLAEIWKVINEYSMKNPLTTDIEKLKLPGGMYSVLYSHYFPPYSGFVGVKPYIDRYTLASCLAMKKHCKALPEEKNDVEVLAEKYALKIMKPKKDRIGGRISGYDIWKALKKARAEQQ